MPPTVDATSSYTRTFVGAAELLAATATFQALVAAADPEADPLDRIEYPELDVEETGLLLPGGIIFDFDGLAFELPKGRHGRGSIGMQLTAEADTATYDNETDQLFDMMNHFGKIVDEMLALGNTNKGNGVHYWNMTAGRKLIMPQWCEDNEYNTKFILGGWILDWV